VTALVTGAGGFAGSHLVDLLFEASGERVHGTTFGGSPEPFPAEIAARIEPHLVDLREETEVAALFERVQPTHVFHLAGPAEVGESFLHPAETIEGMVRICVRVLEAAMKLPARPRVLLVSSAEVYPPSETGLEEGAATQPDSPYAVAKLACEAYGGLMSRRGLPVVIARPFNHIGPRQSDKFVCSGFARQVAEIEAGLREPTVRVGNLSARRDFSDVRDVVSAYPLLLDRGEPGSIWNVASGRALAVSDLLQGLIRISTTQVKVEVDPARLRPVDRPVVVGNAAKLKGIGWSPTVPFEQSLRDTLAYWRGMVGKKAQG
jgi:GDP-4-dehydro-6-deoxy-D-mannose reductase